MRLSVRRLVFRGLPATVLLAVAAAASCARSDAVIAAGAPKATKPLTILYSGTFTMSNVASPQKTAHSYVFRVTWSYWWTGSWGGLFHDPSIFRSSPARFTKVKIAGRGTAA